MRGLERDHHEQWGVFIVFPDCLACLLTVHLCGEQSFILVTDVLISVQIITYLGIHIHNMFFCKRSAALFSVERRYLCKSKVLILTFLVLVSVLLADRCEPGVVVGHVGPLAKE